MAEEEIGISNFDLILRVVCLLAFFALIVVDDGMGLFKHSIDNYIKYGLLGFALIGEKVVSFIPGGKK